MEYHWNNITCISVLIYDLHTLCLHAMNQYDVCHQWRNSCISFLRTSVHSGFFLGIRETQIVGFCVVYCGSLLVFFVPFWTLSVLRFTASDFECFLNILNSRNTYCFPEFQINNKFLYIKYSILLNISVVIINMDSLITFRGRHGRVSIGSTTSYAISAKYH